MNRPIRFHTDLRSFSPAAAAGCMAIALGAALSLVFTSGRFPAVSRQPVARHANQEQDVTITLRQSVRGCDVPQLRDQQIVVTGGDDNERVIAVFPVPADGTVIHVTCVSRPAMYVPPSSTPSYRLGAP